MEYSGPLVFVLWGSVISFWLFHPTLFQSLYDNHTTLVAAATCATIALLTHMAIASDTRQRNIEITLLKAKIISSATAIYSLRYPNTKFDVITYTRTTPTELGYRIEGVRACLLVYPNQVYAAGNWKLLLKSRDETSERKALENLMKRMQVQLDVNMNKVLLGDKSPFGPW